MTVSHENRQQPASRLWLTLLGVGLLVFAPVLWYGGAEELDRWRVAALMEKYLDGKHEEAIAGLREIVARRPGNQEARIVLAGWLVDANQAGEALELVEAVPAAQRSRGLLKVYQNCLLANGRSGEAISVFRELYPANELRTPDEQLFHRNGLSYFQALDGSETGMALRNSSSVVADVAARWNGDTGIALLPGLQAALCAVLIYRGETGRPPAGKEINSEKFQQEIFAILDPVIELLHEELESARAAPGGRWSELNPFLPDFIPFDSDWNPAGTRGIADALAAFLTVRALVYQDLNDVEKSFADRRAVMKLGRDPESIAAKWPALVDCTDHLENLAMFLDTRGCVFYRLDQLHMALGDFQAAVIAQESLVRAGAWHLPGGSIQTADLREHRERFEEQPRKSLAVLLYHRSWVFRELGLEALERADVARVRELGFVPGDHLF